MAKGRKTGGRAKGTPNKVSTAIRENIHRMLSDYYDSEQFDQDLQALTPKERMDVAEKLTSYVVPKLQSTQLEMDAAAKVTIEDRLAQLAADNEG